MMKSLIRVIHLKAVRVKVVTSLLREGFRTFLKKKIAKSSPTMVNLGTKF